MRFDGSLAIVTGASSGIGKAIALELGRCGASVAVNYHSHAEPAQAVVAEIERGGGRALAIQADVSSATDVERLVALSVEQLGPLRVLVNNAGVEERMPFLEKSLPSLALHPTAQPRAGSGCCAATSPWSSRHTASTS